MKSLFASIFFILFAYAGAWAQVANTNSNEDSVPPYTLPDPLHLPGRPAVTSASQWNKSQRAYIYHMFEENVYGRFPSKQINTRSRLLEENRDALHGTAIRRQVRLYLHPTDTTVFTDVLIYLPKSAKPVPLFLGYNFSGNHSIQPDKEIMLSSSWVGANGKGVVNNRATEASRGSDTASWPVDAIISAGYGLATIYYGDIEADQAEGWKTGIRTTMKNVLGIEPQEWSAIGAWAWALSQVRQYLEKEKGVDGKKIAVIGHSRLGKTAVWAGASDTHFAMVISNESGEGGAALSKRFYGETVEVINQKFPHWFVAKYKSYGGHTDQLPLDQHMLLALIAPRPLYVASAEGDQWSDPKGEFLSARHATAVYHLLGKKGIETENMPPLHQPVGETVRYHIRAGRHAITRYDWQQYIAFMKQQLK